MIKKNRLRETCEQLDSFAIEHKRVIVLFSGGKDSLAVMSLAAKFFDEIIAIYLELVPDLEHTREILTQFRRLWPGHKIETVRHPTYYRYRAEGNFCLNGPEWDEIEPPTTKILRAFLMEKYHATETLDGCKKTDFLARRLIFERKDLAGIHPLEHWNKFDVLAYLKRNGIPVPEPIGGVEASSVDLTYESICWFHDRYHSDYLKIIEHFPFAEAFVKRREYYGDD